MNANRLYQNLPRLYDAMRKLLGDKNYTYIYSRGQPRILDYLFHHDGCMQKDFCREYSLEASTVSNLLVAMEKDGLLRRERNPSTSRIVNVYITEKGKQVQHNLDLFMINWKISHLRGSAKKKKSIFL